MSPVANAIAYLRSCIERRNAGHRVAYITDSEWLIDMVINRRSGWPDDPSHTRGSCLPVNGRYPRKASGDYYQHLILRAREINTPRLIIRAESLGEHRWLANRLPERFTEGTES